MHQTARTPPPLLVFGSLIGRIGPRHPTPDALAVGVREWESSQLQRTAGIMDVPNNPVISRIFLASVASDVRDLYDDAHIECALEVRKQLCVAILECFC